MNKLLFATLFLALSSMAWADSDDEQREKRVRRMPEPAGLVELGACAAGLGVWAWRRR